MSNGSFNIMTRRSFLAAGTSDILVSREYDEMHLESLRAVGQTLRAITQRF